MFHVVESKLPRQISLVALVADIPAHAKRQSASAILREYAASRGSDSFNTRAAMASAAQAVKLPIGVLRAVEVMSSEVPRIPSVQRLLTEP